MTCPWRIIACQIGLTKFPRHIIVCHTRITTCPWSIIACQIGLTTFPRRIIACHTRIMTCPRGIIACQIGLKEFPRGKCRCKSRELFRRKCIVWLEKYRRPRFWPDNRTPFKQQKPALTNGLFQSIKRVDELSDILNDHCRSASTAVADRCAADFTAVLFQNVDQRNNDT